MTLQPVVSAPEGVAHLDLGEHRAIHRIRSEDTDGVFSVLELVIEPEEGAAEHVHEHEDELVHVLEGELEVTVGGKAMTAGEGVVALLPRGIAHGYRNRSSSRCRVMDVILPGRADGFFTGLNELIRGGQAEGEALQDLLQRFGITAA